MAKKFSLAQIAAHEFNRSLRVWRAHTPVATILKLIVDEKSKARALYVRALGLAVVGTLWLAANRSELVLKLSLLEVAIPIAYVNFGVAFLIGASLFQFINFMVLNEFTRIAVNKLFKFDNAPALTVLQDSDAAYMLAVLPQYRFFGVARGHGKLGGALALLMNHHSCGRFGLLGCDSNWIDRCSQSARFNRGRVHCCGLALDVVARRFDYRFEGAVHGYQERLMDSLGISDPGCVETRVTL
jgi:hypothetical protein